jgi:hypothetical protein
MTGVTGVTGIFGYFVFDQPTTIGLSQPIPFTTVIASGGIANLGGGTIQVPVQGYYLVSYGASQYPLSTVPYPGPYQASWEPKDYSLPIYGFNKIVTEPNHINFPFPYAAYRNKVGLISLTMVVPVKNTAIKISNAIGPTAKAVAPGGLYGAGGPGAYLTIMYIGPL